MSDLDRDTLVRRLADSIADALDEPHERGTDKYVDTVEALLATYDVTVRPDPEPDPGPMVLVLAPSEDWGRGFLVGRHPHEFGPAYRVIDPALNVPRRIGRGDTVYIIGGWDEAISRAVRVTIERHLHDSGATIRNGDGSEYEWATPRPWEHE